MAQRVKTLPARQKIWVLFLGGEDPLEKGIATHSSILAWRIPWTEELVGYSLWGHKELGRKHERTYVRTSELKSQIIYPSPTHSIDNDGMGQKA